MNVVKEIQRINEREIAASLTGAGSWHDEYKDSAYVFVGGLPTELSEGDVITIFSQYGEIMDINLIRDKQTGKSKGYGFVGYEDQRSTVLSVDNLNGAKVVGRTLRVDHVKNYKRPKQIDENGEENYEYTYNVAPKPIIIDDRLESSDDSSPRKRKGKKKIIGVDNAIDLEDPMADYFRKKAKSSKSSKSKSKSKSEHKKSKEKDKHDQKRKHRD